MTDYSKTKIYKIESHLGDKIYVGSTAKFYLSQRLQQHKNSYKQWKAGKKGKITSFDLFDEYGIDNCDIVLIEDCPCTTKDQKNQKESHYIRTLNCVNKVVPDRKIKEYRQDNKDKIKEYRQDNKDKIAERKKEYYEENKDKFKERKKEYYEENKDKFKEYQKEYRQDNKVKIAEYRQDNKDKIKEQRKKKYQEKKALKLDLQKQSEKSEPLII